MKAKELIKKSFFGQLAVSYLHCVESWLLPKLIDDETYIKRFYKKRAHKDLDLENPQGMNEKMNWYKLRDRNPLMQTCADKYGVREYIISKGYEDSLNKLLAVYDKVEDIDIDALPERFVLKAAHGSHMNIIVKDNKESINWRRQRMMMRSWLRQDIYWSGREWVYKDIPRRIIAEEYLEDETGELKDYKFFCYNGKPYFALHLGNRYQGKLYINFYDMNMQLIDVRYNTIPNDPQAKFPLSRELFEQMKKMATDLSEPFQHVRVDLYEVNGKIYFGEMTFFSGGGYQVFIPSEYDKIWGDYWELKK